LKLIQRLSNVDDVFVFTKQCHQVDYTYTPSFRKDRSRVDWLFVVKTKPRGHVQVFQEGNNEVIMEEDVFHLDELVDPYQVVVDGNAFVDVDVDVDVDAEVLNDIL